MPYLDTRERRAVSVNGQKRACWLVLPILLLSLVFTLAIETQSVREFIVRGWDVEDGLLSSRVNAIAQTPDGYVWLGTLYGLARFDGVRFVAFTAVDTPALGNNHISDLKVDSEGGLWIGTRGSVTGCVSRLHDGKFTRIDLGRPMASVNTFATDGSSMWIGFDAGGVARWSPGGVEWFHTNKGLPDERVIQLQCDSGRVWANLGGHLYIYENGTWRLPVDFTSPQHTRVITRSGAGGLWVATLSDHPHGNRGGVVSRLQDDRWLEELSPYPWNQESPRSKASAVFEDSSGRLWYGAYGGGLFYREPQRPWQQLSARGQLSQVIIDAICEDADGQIWIGTRAAGVYRLEPRAVTTLPEEPDLEPNIFLTACVRRDGSIWGGTDGGGILSWRDGALQRFGAADGLKNLHVGVLFEDRQTNLWAGTWDGLFRLEGARFKAVTGPPTLRKAVLALTEDRSGPSCT